MFERFTERARQTLVLAQEEARLLNHNYIGTEHVLLGLLREPESIASRALTAAGVSLDETRARVTAAVGVGKKPPKSGHIPFTPRAKKVLELSLREALQLGHNYIGTEHLILGILREGNGLAAEILASQTDFDSLRRSVVDLIPASQDRAPKGWRRWLRGRPSEQDETRITRAADVSLDEARRLAGSGAIGSHHLLLAALGDPESAAAKALGAVGVDLERAREALRQVDVAGTSDELPEEAGRRRLRLRLADDQLSLEISDPALVASARAALKAIGNEAAADGVISGDLPVAGSFADVWQALHDSLADIARRATPPNPGNEPGTGDE